MELYSIKRRCMYIAKGFKLAQIPRNMYRNPILLLFSCTTWAPLRATTQTGWATQTLSRKPINLKPWIEVLSSYSYFIRTLVFYFQFSSQIQYIIQVPNKLLWMRWDRISYSKDLPKQGLQQILFLKKITFLNYVGDFISKLNKGRWK